MEKKRPFEGLPQRPAFLFSLAGAAAIVSAMLTWVTYSCFRIHHIGTASFIGLGALIHAFLAWRYFKDAGALRRR